MATYTISTNPSEIEIVWCVTSSGVSVALPASYVRMHVARGIRSVSIGDVLLVAEHEDTKDRRALSVTEAARLLMHDFPHLSLESAVSRISYAARIGRIASTGVGKARRLVADSFDAWRLAERDKDLRNEDER